MSTSIPTTPRFARAFLSSALPPDVREGIVGDLDEVYQQRRSRGGARRARVWYWTQALSIVVRFAPERASGLARDFVSSVGLDLRLGFRMLIKYPMLTVIGTVAITVAATISLGVSEFVSDIVTPDLPLDEGARVVHIVHVGEQDFDGVQPSLFDFVEWRESLRSIEELSAYTTREQGLVGPGGEAGTVSLATITASGLAATRVSPAIGRSITEEDERAGAPPVVVLGHDAWQEVLGADAGILGRTVQIGGVPTTVIGVMPEGFSFPEAQNAWAPLTIAGMDLDPATAARISVFGRLAPGATLESAQSELEARGLAMAEALPVTHAERRPQVLPFNRFPGSGRAAFFLYAVRTLLLLLLTVACANVATLVFARTVTREGEIAIRTSLGASRRRIVLQLFTEALVLVGGATLLALLVARTVLGNVTDLFFTIQQQPVRPFWWNEELSASTVAYAGVLVLVGALLVGVVPALKATKGAVQPRLSKLSAGGGAGLRFGGIWTAIIVLQVALSVAFIPIAIGQSAQVLARPVVATSFPAQEYVTAQLARDQVVAPRDDADRAAFEEESRQLFEEVKLRVAADRDVQSVAFASGIAGLNHIFVPVEVLGDGDSPPVSGGARALLVDPMYLDMMGATVIAGRALGTGDFVPGANAVLVNQSFVDRVLGGRAAVGALLRYPEREGEAAILEVPPVGQVLEIVGVVEDPEIDVYGLGASPTVYAPLSLAPVDSRAVGFVGMPVAPVTQMFVRLRPGAESVAPRLYAILSDVDPALRLADVGTVEQALGPARLGNNIAAWVFVGVAAIVLMLSVAGIYALMSFAVAQRTREIAIRTSVGAGPGRIVATVFGRAFAQLLIGVALGSLIAVPTLREGVADDGLRTLVWVAVILAAAGAAACFGPIRRALRVQPADAIKST